MTIDEILQKVETVNVANRYWFVRTEGGTLFDDFIRGKYIAIGWDYITLASLERNSEEVLKNRIASHEKFDMETPSGKGQSTTVLNKIKILLALKKGDVVIIPSTDSDQLAFGRITDTKTYEAVEAKTFLKRRKVQWIETKNTEDLNAIFYQVKMNQHTLSNLDGYAPHIDRVIGNLFQKGDNTHFVLDIEQENKINFDDLKTLMDGIKSLSTKINTHFNFGEGQEEIYIKINLQSKGALELIKKQSKTLAVLAYVMHLVSCGETKTNSDPDVQKFLQENQAMLDSTKRAIESLKVNPTELTKPFLHGN